MSSRIDAVSSTGAAALGVSQLLSSMSIPISFEVVEAIVNVTVVGCDGR